MPSLRDLLDTPIADLRDQARRLGLSLPASPWREGLVTAIAHASRDADAPHLGCGVLEVHGEGFGFLRSAWHDFQPSAEDIYVSQSQIRRFRLRTGDTVIGCVRPPKEQERYAALLRVELVNGAPAEDEVVPFEQRRAVAPSTRLPIARDAALRGVDLLAPLGLGARGLITGGRWADRADVLRRLAAAFADDDGLSLWVLLVGERPEEVTEWRDALDVEVVASSFEDPPQRQVHTATITLERARRQAEHGEEVVVLVDSLSRLQRAAAADGDAGASAGLQAVRQVFAAGRDLDGAGSVTLIGLVDDDAGRDALLADLDGVATWRLALDAHGVPDPQGSWTHREERLIHADDLERRRAWRATLPADSATRAERLREAMRPTALDSEATTGK